MKLKLTRQDIEKIARACEDAEWIGDDECVIDIYDGPFPSTFDIVIRGDGVYADGACSLKYDEQQDGWYPARTIADADTAESILRMLLP